MSSTPFTPSETVQLAVSAVSSNVAIGKPLGTFGSARQVRVSVLSAEVPTFIAFGKNSSVAATLAGVRLLPGVIELFSVGPEITHIAAITASATSTLSITTGAGE